MKCYVINLDRSPERLAAFTVQAQKAGIDFERFAAIDGKLVPEEELAAQRADRFEFQPINRFETALFLSHRAIWQKLVDSGEPMCAIFEDDVLLSAATQSAFKLISALPSDFDVVKLETTNRKVIVSAQPVAKAADFAMHHLRSWHGGAAAYVLSRKGATMLLARTVKLADPVDQVIFNPFSSISRLLRILQMVPAVAVQLQLSGANDAAVPQTTAGRDQGVRFGVRHGFWIDIQRASKRLLASLRVKLMATQKQHRLIQVQFASEARGATGK